MGIGKRLSRIIKSNVNDLLSAAEDPQKQLDLLITEMEDGLRQAKQELINQVATEKRLQRLLDEADDAARLWAERAQQAVDSGRDDLAREALRKKRTHEELATEYDQQLAEQQRAVDDLRVQYKQLEQRLREYRDRRGSLRAPRSRRGSETGLVARGDAPALRERSAFDKFEEMAEKVDDLEARTQAERELSSLLDSGDELAARIETAGTRRSERREQDEADLKVDLELEELRKRSGRSGAAGEATGRRSVRRSLGNEPATPPADQAPAPQQPDDRPAPDDDEGWGRRVEL